MPISKYTFCVSFNSRFDPLMNCIMYGRGGGLGQPGRSANDDGNWRLSFTDVAKVVSEMYTESIRTNCDPSY